MGLADLTNVSVALSRPQDTYCKNALYWDLRAASPTLTGKTSCNISWTLIFDDYSLCIVYTKEDLLNQDKLRTIL